jgi:hypothetical protein
MIKLISLLEDQDLKNEIKILPQISPQNKEKIFNITYEFDEEVFRRLIGNDTLEEFLRDLGYYDLTEYIENEFFFEGEDIKKAEKIITDYYSAIHPGDVYLPPDNTGSVAGYQKARVVCFEEDCDLILTKF